MSTRDPMDDEQFLNWVADRLVCQHGDSENHDHIRRLRAMAKDTKKPVHKIPEWNPNAFATSHIASGTSFLDEDLRALFRHAEAGYRFAVALGEIAQDPR